MKVYEVLIEYSTSKLDRLFSYVYDGEINLLCRVIVPFAHKDICGVVINIIDFQGNELDYKNKTGFELKKIKKVIDKTPLLNEELNNLTNNYYYSYIYKYNDYAIKYTALYIAYSLFNYFS